ncbi:MAG: ABC transporter ATP-binding protein/permease [Oscillospiraceae bacterium]|jgi:ATP-binding cassette subfamily B protein|nr:ABC transporter ATP-binding protein/permease [Oscillospiraceae bacterium]
MAEERKTPRTAQPGIARRGGFGPGSGAAMSGERAKDAKGAFGKLLRYLRPYRPTLVLVLLLAVTSTVFGVLGPRQIGDATTLLANGILGKITGAGGGIDFSAIGVLMAKLIALYGLSALFSFLQGYLMAGVATKVAYQLRSSLLQKVNRLPVAYFNRNSHGDVLSRITNDVDTLNQSLNQGVSSMITSVTTILGITIMMFTASWRMALAAICVIPVIMGMLMLVLKASQKYFTRQQQMLGTVNGQVEETYAGHTVVKAFGAEAQVIKAFDDENKKLYRAAWKAQFLSGVMQPITVFLGNLNYVVVCIYGAALVAGGSLDIGKITEFIMYIRQFNQPFMQMAQIMNIFQQTAAAAERVFEFLEEAEESTAAPAALPPVQGNVRFAHVRFGYEDSDEIVIKDFNAEIRAGQKIAIVGPTGAGKTTLVKLLMRFHDLTQGEILIDGHNIADYPRQEIRKAMGMVLQDAWLTNASIADNIRYGRLDATDEQVKAAAKAAQAHSFIRALPEGYRFQINEEANNISQGQKQLLTIARAVLADNRILILDEATSSVDTRTEILIQKAMDHLMEGRTSFIIAHRLSTIRNADLILCLDHGDIVEQGSHEELIAQNGFYARLYNSQFEHLKQAG